MLVDIEPQGAEEEGVSHKGEVVRSHKGQKKREGATRGS